MGGGPGKEGWLTKLLTLNTHSLQEKDYLRKLEQFVEVLLREKPDVAALQEVNQSVGAPPADLSLREGYVPCPGLEIPVRQDNHAAQTAFRLRRAGISCSWTWAPAKIGYGIYDEGLALLALNGEIRETDSFYISGSRDYENWRTRKALGVRVSSMEGWFYSVHLGWWQDAEEPFSEQWRRLSAALDSRKEGGPVWLMGDFNSPDGTEGEGYDLVAGSGWHDAYRLAGEKDGGVTVEGPIDGWRDAAEGGSLSEGMRMDYLWCSCPARVKSSQVVFNGKNGPIISDHFGVLTEVDC